MNNEDTVVPASCLTESRSVEQLCIVCSLVLKSALVAYGCLCTESRTSSQKDPSCYLLLSRMIIYTVRNVLLTSLVEKP